MTHWRSNEPKTWHWRIRARSSTGHMVTLGKYDTEDEARKDHDRIIKDACYREATIERITPAHEPG